MPRLKGKEGKLKIGSSASFAFRRLLEQLEEEHCRALVAARSEGNLTSLPVSLGDSPAAELQPSCKSLATTQQPSPTDGQRLTTQSSVRFADLPEDSNDDDWDLKLASHASIGSTRNSSRSSGKSNAVSESADYSFNVNTYSSLRSDQSGRSCISNLPQIQEGPTEQENIVQSNRQEFQKQLAPSYSQLTQNEGLASRGLSEGVVSRGLSEGKKSIVSESSRGDRRMRGSYSQATLDTAFTDGSYLPMTSRSPLGNSLSWKAPGSQSRRVSQLEYDTCYQRISNMQAKKQIAKERLRQSIAAQQNTLMAKFCDLLGDFCEGGVSAVIILNGILIGVQTDYHARNVTDEVPKVFVILETVFCVIFLVELIVKLFAYRLKFFYMQDWAWNWFDTLLVIAQVVDVAVMLGSELGSEQSKMMQVFRIVRMSRVFRLVRLLHYIGELATIVSSITNSLRALGWTVVLLLMMIYMCAIFFTQTVTTHRIGLESDSESLSEWWGSLSRSCLSLYQAILGGVDWQRLTHPLESEIHTLCSLMFYFYIAFALLAMLNIFTGTFVQSALRAAENERTQDFRVAAQNIFMPFGPVHVSYMEFEHKVHNSPFKDWLDCMGILGDDAKLLFKLLQTSDYEPVQSERLISAMVSLREGAKFLDIMKLMYALRLQTGLLEQWTTKLSTTNSETLKRFSMF